MLFDPSKLSLKATIAYQKLKAASVQYVLMQARVVVGLFIRIIGFTDTASTSDSKAVSFGKAVSDAAITLESVSRSLAKIAQDSAVTSDQRQVHFGKAAADISLASDSLTRAANKALTDAVGTSEAKAFVVAKSLVSTASSSDSLQRVVSFVRSFSDAATSSDVLAVASTKTRSDSATASDSFERSIGKLIADQVIALDDLNGASVDDDQHIQFVKVLSEAALVSESLSKTVSYFREYSESAVVTDVAAQTFTKLLFDAVTVTDSSIVGRLVNREDLELASVSDQKQISAEKSFIESVIAADLAAVAVSKALAESVGLSDLTVRAADKGLTEGVSSPDSGNLFGQGYVSEEYFAERYVGYERTF